MGVVLVATDVEAKRLGGARSSGVQRNVTAPPASTPAKPAQQQAAPQGQQAAPAAAGVGAAAAAAPKAGLAKWFPMLGGLALGGLLGYLFATNGGSLLLLLMLVAAGVAIAMLVARRRQGEQTMQYAGGGQERIRMPETVPSGSGAGVPAPQGAALPAGFNADSFLRSAKMNFARLQLANDRGDLEDLREFTTPQMFESLAADIRERAGSAQQTDISGLEADLVEVVREGDQYWASVRFSGTAREAPGAAPEPFAEVWNLAKPADGSSGWLLAGIQQLS